MPTKNRLAKMTPEQRDAERAGKRIVNMTAIQLERYRERRPLVDHVDRPPTYDLTGKRFGRLLVIGRVRVNGRLAWTCQCDCGDVKSIAGVSLRGGRTRSCGCLRADDNRSRVATYEARLWDRLDKSGPVPAGRPDLGPCWVLTGGSGRDKDGYVRVQIGGKMIGAHRLAWERANGPIGPGLFVCHHCDNPPCVRPEHLFLGDHAANMLDRRQKGRQASGNRSGSRLHPERRPRGERNAQAKLTSEQVASIRTRFAAGLVSKSALAREFGVSYTAIYYVLNRRSWRDA